VAAALGGAVRQLLLVAEAVVAVVARMRSARSVLPI
jgi:hypothetical protein